MIAKWEDVVNRKHTLESSKGDHPDDFLNAVFGMIGSTSVEIDGVPGKMAQREDSPQAIFVPKQ